MPWLPKHPVNRFCGHKSNSRYADSAEREVLDMQGVTKSGKVNNTLAPNGGKGR